MSLAQGDTLGQYEVERLLGTGGMGQVYLARDTGLDRLVALKTLLPSHVGNEAVVKRFEVEARAIAKFKHPNIVQVYQVDVSGPTPYIAMEYIEGQPLDQVIKQHGPLKWQHALNVCAQVTAALEAAHAQGIIHRDIKPANILVDKKWGVHVTDFGIAKVLEQTQGLTATDTALGSPSYMSPEHCGVGEVVPASDLFSLGVTLYEAITGELPFKAENALAVMHKIVNDPHAPLFEKVDDLPPIVPMIVDTLMEKKQDGRYSTATQVLEDLRAFREGKQPTHVTMLRKKVPGRDTTHYEIAEVSSDILGTAKDQALVAGLFEGVETNIQPPVIRMTPTRYSGDSTSGWTYALMGGAVMMFVVFAGLGIAASRYEDKDDGDDEHREGTQYIQNGQPEAQQPPPRPDLPDGEPTYPTMAGQRGYTPEGYRVHTNEYYNPDTMLMYEPHEFAAQGLPAQPVFREGFQRPQLGGGPGAGGQRPPGPGPGGNRLPPPRQQ